MKEYQKTQTNTSGASFAETMRRTSLTEFDRRGHCDLCSHLLPERFITGGGLRACWPCAGRALMLADGMIQDGDMGVRA